MGEQWWTSGMIFKDRLVCQFYKSGITGGFLYGETPLNNPASIVLFQMFLIFFFTRTIYFIFQPLRQSMIVAQIVAGFVMGPLVLTHYRVLANKLFPPPGRYVLKTISSFGFMLHLFIMGVKIDIAAIRSTGLKSIIIGLSGLIFSVSFGAFAFYVVRQHTQLDQNLFTGIRILITFNSLTFFMVTSGYIHDLKYSNSELGRLASSCSLVVDLLGLLSTTISLTWFGTTDDTSDIAPRLMNFFSVSFYYAVLFCILRPLVLYIVSRTPQGATTMKQTHLLLILTILMLAWFWGESLGQSFATFLFGLSLPDGPPLGPTLVHKFELFTSGVLLPVFCTMAGWKTNLSSWKGHSQVWGIELVFVIGHLSKLFGIVVSSIIAGLSFQDAMSLSLIMSFKGIMEVATLNTWSDRGLLDDRLFSLSMMNIVLFTGVAFPLVQHLYDPSKQYNSTKKRTILDIGESNDLRLLVCIHNVESVDGIINLVKLVNNVFGTISLFTLQLKNSTGSLVQILEPLYKYKKWDTSGDHYEDAVDAFTQFEKESKGLVKIQHYVSVTPYKSMHIDICSLAHDKQTSIIITPFYKRWGVKGTLEACSHQIKEVNTRLVMSSPCSVAILIDKKGGRPPISLLSGRCIYHIVMLFVGGSDDYEALALATRMSDHQSVRLTVIWLRSKDYQPPKQEFEQDAKIMADFHVKAKNNDKISLREHYSSNGTWTAEILLPMQHADLFIVGKYHEPECPLIQGLTSLNESQEIGALGDLLATSDFQFSVLVVQQPQLLFNSNSSKIDSSVDDLIFESFNDSLIAFRPHTNLGV